MVGCCYRCGLLLCAEHVYHLPRPRDGQLAGLACFLGGEFVGIAGRMCGAPAFSGDLALAFRIHRAKSTVAGVAALVVAILLATLLATLVAALIAALIAFAAALVVRRVFSFVVAALIRSHSRSPRH